VACRRSRLTRTCAVELQRLGTRLVEQRTKRGCTQDKFTDKSGFQRGEINLAIGSLLLLAQTLKVKVGELFRGIEE